MRENPSALDLEAFASELFKLTEQYATESHTAGSYGSQSNEEIRERAKAKSNQLWEQILELCFDAYDAASGADKQTVLTAIKETVFYFQWPRTGERLFGDSDRQYANFLELLQDRENNLESLA